MKTFVVAAAIAVGAVFSLSDAAQAWHWVHVGPYFHSRLIVDPVVAPVVTTVPEVVVGPHGHLHYVRAL
jgi:hypothetical protein